MGEEATSRALSYGGEWRSPPGFLRSGWIGKGAAAGREGRACETGRAGSGGRVRGETKWRPPLLRLPAP